MSDAKISWDFCQKNSDDILNSGLEQLRLAKKYDSSHHSLSATGNYVILFNDTPLYIGEAKDLKSRLKQQFYANTSTFFKSYVKKQSQLDIEKNLQVDNFEVKYVTTRVGRKELEEFGIVNFPTPLNKFQLGKRNNYRGLLKSDLWGKVQDEYFGIIESGGKAVIAAKPCNWLEATPLAKAGVYIVFNHKNEIIYIGESSNIGDRYKTHGKDTYFSAFRRNLGTNLLGFRLKERKGKKRYFEPNEDSQVDNYIRNCKIILKMINFGRFELEEYLIRNIQPVLNKKSK
ncbi:MAG: GIY-YIG nuclease family protein [candidate division Zixibacteria bacterium]|nr:GIY-YIG nuclease family protein [candidate division Zixibacteria bacterium]